MNPHHLNLDPHHPDLDRKAGALILQLNRLRDRLKEFEINGVIVAPLDLRDLTLGGLESCASANIGLLLRDQLSELFSQVTGRDWPDGQELALRLLRTSPPRPWTGAVDPFR